MNDGLEEPLAPALGVLAVVGALGDVGNHTLPGSTDLGAPLCPSREENHGVDERSRRGVSPASRAGTKLGRVCKL